MSKHQPYTNKKREKYQIDGSCKTFKDQLKMWKMRRLRQRHKGEKSHTNNAYDLSFLYPDANTRFFYKKKV